MAMEKEEFLAWLQDPRTQEVMKLLERWEQGLKDQWARGGFAGEDIEAYSLMNAEALGQVQVLRRIRDLEFEQYFEAMSDD